MSINKKEYPLIVTQAFIKLFKECQAIAAAHEDTVTFSHSAEDYYLRFNDKDPKSRFVFTINSPSLPATTVAKPIMHITRFPKTENIMSESSMLLNMEDIPRALKTWLGIVNAFNITVLNPEDLFEKKYVDDLYIDFKMAEGDADSMPFDDEKQFAIIKLLEYIKDKVESNDNQDEKTAEIKKEIIELQNSVQKLSKNQTMNKLAKIGAKIKMKGYDFVKHIFGIAKEETYKFVIKKMLEEGPNFVNNLIHHLG